MTTVELLYFPNCPNIADAREQVRRALTTVGIAPVWDEFDMTADDAPAHARGYGSPTVLVDGRDVTGAAPGGGPSCRIYTGTEVRGVPPLDAIIAALQGSTVAARSTQRIAPNLAVVPGALLSLLPVLACPACWPAYAGVLGSLGIPFLMRAAWLLPITAAALLIALAGLGHRARERRGFGPLALGVVATGAILVGRFALGITAAAYVGTMSLVGASIWNTWPRASVAAPDACGCAPGVNPPRV